MRIHIIFSLLFIVSGNLFSQILPLEPSGKPPVFFYSPSHVLVAEEIANKIMKKFDIKTVRVTLHKPNAPVDVELRDVSVSVERLK